MEDCSDTESHHVALQIVWDMILITVIDRSDVVFDVILYCLISFCERVLSISLLGHNSIV